jgi:hypothetical protein
MAKRDRFRSHLYMRQLFIISKTEVWSSIVQQSCACVRACVQRCPYGSVCLLDQESWSLSDLAQELECGDSLAILRRRVNYWVQQGILRAAGGDVYELMTERPKDGQDATHKYDQDEGMV